MTIVATLRGMILEAIPFVKNVLSHARYGIAVGPARLRGVVQCTRSHFFRNCCRVRCISRLLGRLVGG